MHALILIDIQTGFDAPVWGTRNNPQAEDRAGDLLAHARARACAKDWAIFHIRHISTTPGSPLSGAGTTFKPQVTPRDGEAVIDKSVNSAFIGTDLETRLRERAITDLVICGLTTPHCVSTTTRMAANLGFCVTLAHDACAAFTSNADTTWADLPPLDATTIHNTALSHLHGEFASVRAVADITAHE
ncbi:cysteine hydrolase family protein [Celeribacter arenosi]|uniref:Cysteine hydrolase family protein n=1 Tax=Celeribacter arenosi TaxID=792649 RepID=A0ABP7JU55_9RHOB